MKEDRIESDYHNLIKLRNVEKIKSESNRGRWIKIGTSKDSFEVCKAEPGTRIYNLFAKFIDETIDILREELDRDEDSPSKL